MFRNYLKTAIRNFKRNKAYALINTLGLAVGIAASLLIFLTVQYESSFDNFHSKKNSIYRVGTEFHNQDGTNYSGGVSFPVAPALRVDFPELKEVASIYRNGVQVTIENANGDLKKLNEDNFYFAEPSFFKIFDFGWLAGNPQTSLNGTNNAVLTQSTADHVALN